MLLHVIWKTNTFPFWIFFHARCSFSALLILHHTSSLTSPRNVKFPKHKYEIFLKFWAIFLSTPCHASHRPLCSVFHQMRRIEATIASNLLLHRVNSVILLNPFLSQKPQNRRRANPMMDPWPQMLTCDPGSAGQWEQISFQGWDPTTDSGSQTHRSRHWTEPMFSVHRL